MLRRSNETPLYTNLSIKHKLFNTSSTVISIFHDTSNILAFDSNPYLSMKINLINNMLLNLETLPKPYVPSAVPLFTGRKAEIEEITNLITDQSTRLLNIWGSPGFGKTSTAIEVARNLFSLDCPVYFFKLQGISTVDEFLSKILGIFRSNLVDLTLKPIDKVVSIFREISSPIFLIFDNVDDFLSSESGSATLTHLFKELLDSNVDINVIFTTRELLENMRDQIEGFQDIRIRPLHPVSSVEFVRQRLPLFSENVVAKVAEICSHVPLAMKLVASLVENNTEDMANKILEELSLPGDLLEQIDSPYEKSMKRLLEVLFEKLTLSDKHALISLTVFSSARINKDAAIEVASGEMGVTKVVRSLKTLVKKSLIDEDRGGEYYSIHPLICSFVVDKAKQSDFEDVFNTSSIRFCRYYFLLFEKLNDNFLAGKSVESPQLEDTMQNLPTVFYQTSAKDFENFQDLFRILSKAEIFLSLTFFGISASVHIPKLYDLAMEKCRIEEANYTYSKLYVSKYFDSITFSFFTSHIHSDIPEHIREDVRLLSDGSAAKLGCYEGISLISKGNIESGIECIEKHIDDLQRCPDQQLVKCLCLQLLALYYTNLKEYSKSSKLSRKAIEVCGEIGNYDLFLIGDCEQPSTMMLKEYKGEQLVFFICLLHLWSNQFLNDEAKLYFFNVVHHLLQQLESNTFGSMYLLRILAMGECLLALLGLSAGKESVLDEKINFLESLTPDGGCPFTDATIPSVPDSSSTSSHLAERLLLLNTVKMITDDHARTKSLIVETCCDRLDISLKLYGEQHVNTALCYLKIGLAENDAENYISALNAFDKAVEIMTAHHDGSNSSNANLAEVYMGKGKTCTYLKKSQSAIASYEDALKIRRTLYKEDSEEIAEILFLLGISQFISKDLSSALATLEQVLQIRVKVYAEKPNPSSYGSVLACYAAIGNVHYQLGNQTESNKCFTTALKLSTVCDQERSLAQRLIFANLLNLKVDENVDMELLKSSLPVIMKGSYKEYLIPLYLALGSKQLESGKYEAGLASLQQALDIELDITLKERVEIRMLTVSCYIAMVQTLIKIGEFKLARKTIDRVIKIAESLPELGGQHLGVFRCYSLKGCIHNEMREFPTAIESLKHALLHVTKISDKTFVKFDEFICRIEIATAYCYERSYKDALTSMYDALSIIKDLRPEGSVDEAKLYLFITEVARKMENKSLVLSNLRLAYKMYSNILGETHVKTQQCYIAYARALIKLG